MRLGWGLSSAPDAAQQECCEPGSTLLCMGLFSRFFVQALPCTAEGTLCRVRDTRSLVPRAYGTNRSNSNTSCSSLEHTCLWFISLRSWDKRLKYQDYRFSIAPMMDWTDRHCRVFHRAMTRRARLYTEMLTTGAILHGDRARLLGFDAREHPVALQLGGSEPRDLAAAAKIAEDFGYDEINLNVGCPSDRVKDGRFGACLMAEPALVAAGVDAMKRAVNIPVTVKCRIGIDDQDPEIALDALARGVVAAGADALIVHARKAWLNGLSPRENRDIPPLDYDRVYRLKAL